MFSRDKYKDPLRILLIEDNPGDVRLIREMLKEVKFFSYEIIHADRLALALRTLSKEKIDIILTDLGLPDAHGLTALNQLFMAATNLPVVVLTSTDESIGRDAVQKGAQDYLIKNDIDGRTIARALIYAIERKKAQLKSEFTAIVSHELRTPLSIIKEGVLLTLEDTEGMLTINQKENLNVAKANIERLERLINNVLNFSRLEAGKVKFVWERIDLKNLIQEVSSFINPIIAKKGLLLNLELPEQPLIAVCDKDQIEQVLINLLDNAIKFTNKGAITVRLIKLNHTVQLEVEDTGDGIKEKDQARVFDFFTQGSYEGRKRTGGVGLGLAICRLIITSHKGEISLESQGDKGTKFKISFPDSQDSEQNRS